MSFEHMIIRCAMTLPQIVAIACQLRLLTWHSSFFNFFPVPSAKMTVPLPCMQPASMHTKALAGHHAQPRSCSLPRAHRTSSSTRRQRKHICHAAKANGKPAIQGEGAAWMTFSPMQSQVWLEALPMEAAMPHPRRLYFNAPAKLGLRVQILQSPSCAHCEPCLAPHLL